MLGHVEDALSTTRILRSADRRRAWTNQPQTALEPNMYGLLITFRTTISLDQLEEPFTEYAHALRTIRVSSRKPGCMTETPSEDSISSPTRRRQTHTKHLSWPLDLRAMNGFDDFEVRGFDILEGLSELTGVSSALPLAARLTMQQPAATDRSAASRLTRTAPGKQTGTADDRVDPARGSSWRLQRAPPPMSRERTGGHISDVGRSVEHHDHHSESATVASSSVGTMVEEPTTTPTTGVPANPASPNNGYLRDADQNSQETGADVSLSIECTRGVSLNDLGIDITRVPFVDDDAPDDTTWIEIITELVNPTDERVAVDPGFAVTFLGSDGEELATQPWADGADPVYLGLEATNFVIEPNQTFTRRLVVFDGYSGTLFLRDNHDRLLESLESCTLSGEPDFTTLEPYEPPVGVSLEIGACAPTEDGSIFETTLVAESTGDAAVQFVVAVELVDDAGDRIAVVGSGEQPVSIEPGATETRTLAGAAWPVDDLSSIAECRIYSAEAPSWQT